MERATSVTHLIKKVAGGKKRTESKNGTREYLVSYVFLFFSCAGVQSVLYAKADFREVGAGKPRQITSKHLDTYEKCLRVEGTYEKAPHL
jgi:hypothetical protein